MVALTNPPMEQFFVKPSKPNTTPLIIPDIPLIDLSKPESKHHLVKACQDFGFFKVVNHGVPAKFINKLESEAVKFFDSPLSVKEKSGPPDPFGYGNKSIGRNGDVGWVEYLLLNTKPESVYPINFRGVVNDYVTLVRHMACEIMELLADEMKLQPRNVFSKLLMDENSDSVFRLNHYPPFPEFQQHAKDDRKLVGFGEHTDPQIISVLRSNNASGLEIFLRDGSWMSVPPDSESFFINVGDSLQVFGSHEELMNWVKNMAHSVGVVVVTKRSNKYSNGFMHKTVLMCDRGGKYKVKESSKVSGTKKTDCPFEIEGRYSMEYNSWTLTVICDEHNHPPVQYMEGHPYAKRLTNDEFSFVAELTRMNVAPRDILSMLKERNLGNASTLSTIYNARSKIRMIQQAGNSPMQVLMCILHSNGYVYEFTTNGSNELENLFFVHPTSFDTWRAFPQVLIIDATYKTNNYNMPFVQIVGVTSTNKTFSIAFAFMQNEQTVNYRWVLNCLKLTLDKCMHPRVILTDRELALVNACKEVFPDAAQLLCRWHISRNIFKNCRQSVRSARDWENFLYLWKLLEDSTTLVSYTENYKQLESFLTKYPRVLKYINENWLNKYKEMFVSVWIDQHLNFGNNTTNRVESQHAVLKKYLKSSKSCFDKFVGCINRIVQSQHTSIKESFEKSRVVRVHKHNIRCFKLLHGVVSNEALDKILADYERWNSLHVDSSICGCRLRNSCGLPCACELSMYISSGQCISLDSIDIFWRKLDFLPLTSLQNDDVSCDIELKHYKDKFNKQSKIGKKSLLKKLKDIIGLGTTDIQEPRVQKNTRGRPSLKKSQQKRRPNVCSARYSCSDLPNFVDPTKEPDRHSSFEFDLNNIPEEFECPYVINLNEVPPLTYSNIMLEIPKVFHPYIKNIHNVLGDGNCGYRALAVCLGFDEENYYEYIRQQMREELQNRFDFYKSIFTRDANSLYNDLCFFGSPCPFEHWMKMPEAGVLIANRFGVIVHSLSMSGSTTIFPFWSGPEDSQHHKVLTIALVFNETHFVVVELQEEYPMPMITAYWNFDNISQSATRWETMYKPQLELYTQLCPPESEHNDLSDSEFNNYSG